MHKRRAGVIASVAVAVVATAGVVWIVRSAAADTSDAGKSENGASQSGGLAGAGLSSQLGSSPGASMIVSVPPLPSTSGAAPSTPEVDPTTSSSASSSLDPSEESGQQTSGSSPAAAKKVGPSAKSTAAVKAGTSTASTASTPSTPSTPSTTKATPTTTTPTPDGTTTSRSSYPDSITPRAASQASVDAAVKQAVEEAADEGITQSVVIIDRKTGKTTLSINADQQMPSVSIAKLIFAADWMDNAGGGAKLPADELADLDKMISTSDDDIASDYYGYNGEGDIVTRVAKEYGLSGTEPYQKNPRYWGGIEITARDIGSLLKQVLSDPKDGPYLSAAMRDSTHDGADGYDQEFGMNAVSGAGSKQGWGCCLGGVVAIHSAGFTANQIVVVLSSSYPDADGINQPAISAFEYDPGFVAAVKASTRTARAAVGADG